MRLPGWATGAITLPDRHGMRGSLDDFSSTWNDASAAIAVRQGKINGVPA
jgi:hypothetical protein